MIIFVFEREIFDCLVEEGWVGWARLDLEDQLKRL